MSDAPFQTPGEWTRSTGPSRATFALLWLLIFVLVASSVGALVLLPRATSGPSAVASSSAGATKALTGAQLAKAPTVPSPGPSGLQGMHATAIGPVAPSTPVLFTVGFQMRNPQMLEQVLADQATQGSAGYRHWLTLQQEQQWFGADPVEVQNTINFYTTLGFHVETVGPISVSFSGTAAQAESAFRSPLVQVVRSDGTTAMAPALPISIPAPIAPGVASISGLGAPATFHVEHFPNPILADAGPSDPQAIPATGGPYVSNPAALNYSNHAFLWVKYYSHRLQQYVTWQFLTPGALNYLYNATDLLAQGSNGHGITIALVMAGGINSEDLRNYGEIVWNNPNNIVSRLQPTPIDGAYKMNDTFHYTDDGSNEMALDIEYSSTMAPGATIMPVYGPCLCTNVLDDDYAKIDSMATLPNIISNSWGGDEDSSGNLYGPNYQNDITMHDYFMLIDARGSTILASSGDGGGFDVNTGMLAPSFPADDPYVLSVNGLRTAAGTATGQVFPQVADIGLTNLSLTTTRAFTVHVDTAMTMPYQSFWYVPFSNQTLLRAPPSASGGFGESYWFNQSWWQHGANVPDLGRSLGSGVAAEADFNESIYFNGTWEFFYGGTSFACPTTAGELADVESYLVAHGKTAYLGNGNVPVWWVANAYWNGNLSVNPFYDVTNGTSYWGDQGVYNQWEWPPGQKFPFNSRGFTTYGNATPGWDFPTGWGALNVRNFAEDLNSLLSLPGQFQAVNSAGTQWNPGAWADFALNHTYTLHVNASASLALSFPKVTVVFHDENGLVSSYEPSLTYSPSPANGYQFTLDTTQSIFDTPGYIVFEFGNATNPTLGFAYSYIAQSLPTGGTLQVSLVTPSSGHILGGYAEYNVAFWSIIDGDLGIGATPGFGPAYPNTAIVKVTYNGQPVYNAKVTDVIPAISDLPWVGSQAQARTTVYGGAGAAWQSPLTLSQTFTNVSGEALVYTWNVIKPTNFTIIANYSTASATTQLEVDPGPNVYVTDAFGGHYSNFDFARYLLGNTQQLWNYSQITPAIRNSFIPNSVAQSALYNITYAFAGQMLNVHVNDARGVPMAADRVWLANFDGGTQNHFTHYEASFGLLGVTNTSGTSAYTNAQGEATIYVPQNQSIGLGGAFIAADAPGQSNRTFQYGEPCAPNAFQPVPLITCVFNESYQRNYTSAPVLVLPDPVHAITQTTAGVARDFFGSGSNISVKVDVNIPTGDPLFFPNTPYYAWSPRYMDIVNITAYVDGQYAGNLTPGLPGLQDITEVGNLTGSYGPGVHVLTVVVYDRAGHELTYRHTFVVGSIEITDRTVSDVYTVLPFNLTWFLNIPAGQINNHTFNQSLEIRYISGGCGGTTPCQQVVNYSVKIHDGVAAYQQNLNRTLLNLQHFYSGAGDLPPGQYQLIVWVNANHSGSIATQITTYLVFDPVTLAITGPSADALVPLGNVTIAYAYSGQYIEDAHISVYPASAGSSPVFTQGALVPGVGSRGGSTTWTAVSGGPYRLVLNLTTPYGEYNTTEWVNVSTYNGLVYLNQSHAGGPIGGLGPALTATILALVGAVVGLLLGLWLAPRTGSGRGAATAARPVSHGPKPWDESHEVAEDPTVGAAPVGAAAVARTPAPSRECSLCHDKFETAFALEEHRKIVHGLER